MDDDSKVRRQSKRVAKAKKMGKDEKERRKVKQGTVVSKLLPVAPLPEILFK